MLVALLMLLAQFAPSAQEWPVQPVILAVPSYPPLLARARTQGSVEIIVEIDNVGCVHGLRTLGSANPHFERVVREALSIWRFAPARDTPLRTLTLEVRFVLDATSDPNDTSPLRPARVAPGLIEIYGRTVVIERSH